jgi:hypothetical protein
MQPNLFSFQDNFGDVDSQGAFLLIGKERIKRRGIRLLGHAFTPATGVYLS